MNPTPFRRAAAWAALMLALSYLLAFGLQATLFNPGPGPGLSVAARFDFLLQHQRAFQAWLLLYPLMALMLAPLILGLQERLQPQAPQWMALAVPMGWIWVALLLISGMVGVLGVELAVRLNQQPENRVLALGLAQATGVIQNALGGGNELVGGVWTLLLAAAARGQWGRGLMALSGLIGVAGVLSIWPPFADAVMVFGLGQILWFGAVAQWLWCPGPQRGLAAASVS
ncbi:hypothetical protein HNQ51_002276 [Inhella inkyongensis]|uniref:DUF4386 family protein n=1 Tax=Inhella inkyongensis TaxID=392593 RepID=A0A840S1E9_9BURK|nr:hypothetical protein [Inhella inkyongensis]MBB5204957.1 hypothetical protein [Inhella inkyongensis]